MSEEPQKRAHFSDAARELLMGSNRDRALKAISESSQAFEEHLNQPKSSADVLLSVEKRMPEIWSETMTRLGLASDECKERLESADPSFEPPAEPSKWLAKHDVGRAPYTQILKESMRTARDKATAAGRERWTAGEFLAALVMHPGSIARRVFLELGSREGDIGLLAEWLEQVPDPVPKGSWMDQTLLDMQAVRYAAMATYRREHDGPEGSPLRKLYEENPEEYRQKPDLLKALGVSRPDPTQEWFMKCAAVKSASRWEALDRKAPEATLAHLLLALITDGTDSANYLDEKGVSREELRKSLDELAPRFEEGPLFPEDSPPYMMCSPSPPHYPKPFSDLGFLLRIFDHLQNPVTELLSSLGLSADGIRFALRSVESGDPEWHTKKPDLVSLLKREARREAQTSLLRSDYCMEAASYEARIRHDPMVRPAHLLIALLVNGTDTYGYVQSLGVDVAQLIARLEDSLPKHDKGPIFPKKSIDLTVAVHPLVTPFSDLFVIRNLIEKPLFSDERAEWQALLTDFGMTPESIRNALPPVRDLRDQ